jgi:CRISPR-associated protein Cas2
MADKRHLHLVSYDIRDPKRWRRAYRILRGYGVRIQYSVFRVHGTAQKIAKLRWELQRVLDPEDALLVLRFCPSCAQQAAAVHEERQWSVDETSFKILG